MEIKIINTENQYKTMLDWVDLKFDEKINPDSKEGKKLKIALVYIKEYEDLNYSIPKTNI